MVDMQRIDTNPRSGGNAVEVRGLVKHYGATKALDGVDLDVREGTVLGVLGPNGAGKTTLVRCLSTLITPDAGHAVVAGYDVVKQPRELRRRIGLTGQYASVDEKLSGWENLYMIGRLLDLPAGRRGPGRTSCLSGSRSPRPPSGPAWSTAVACAAGSTWPPR